MANWVDMRGWEISVHNMDDAYVNNLIGFIARGGGWNPEIVLGFIDDLYLAAKQRKILRGLPAMLLKRYTRKLWHKFERLNGRKYAWTTPRWVDWLIERYCPHRDH